MSSSLLKQSFQEMLGPAKQMQSRYISEMQQKATTPMRPRSCRW